MTQKIKSLIYFTCFVIASLTYYTVEIQDNMQAKNENIVAKADLNDQNIKQALVVE